MSSTNTSPNRIPWPPILYLAAAVAAVGLGVLVPGPDWLRHPALAGLGWALLLAGLGLDLAAMATMRRHRANILPHRAATALVTSGPFAWSRNPIYLGNTVALCGAALAFANPWFLPAAFAAALAVTHLAIRREEAHLAQRFGAAWAAYRRVHPPDLGGAEQKLFEYLSGWLGGPPLYVERHGAPMLRRRHLHAPIGDAEAAGWLLCFQRAWDELIDDPELAALVMPRVESLAAHMRNVPAP
jgi:protein-S-isoprenylcysteine O-methyltransferase Ste14